MNTLTENSRGIPGAWNGDGWYISSRARAAWARLIHKVYEADPLECPKCNGQMRVIALIEDPGIIHRILDHLGLWAPLPTERSPPLDPASWPPYASLPAHLPPGSQHRLSPLARAALDRVRPATA